MPLNSHQLPASDATPSPVRVMIVDDAVVVRGLLARWLEEAGGIEIVSTHRTGIEAVNALADRKPDVVVLDIDMPEMDGVTALPLILRALPKVSVIMASTLTTRNADISLRCLAMGAHETVAKPATNRELTFSVEFRREIIAKVKALGMRHALRQIASLPTATPMARPMVAMPVQSAKLQSKELLHVPFSKVLPKVLLIGASTGGPRAIMEFLQLCKPVLQVVPVVIVQHMPAIFTQSFADSIRKQLTIDSSEAQQGEVLERGRVYVAPGGRHLTLERHAGSVRVALDDTAPVNFCRPSVDVAFLSTARVFGAATLAVVLTGMGSEGQVGAAGIVEQGGTVLAQDEASSVVWGMPGAVARHGLSAAVAPVDALASLVKRLAAGERL